MRYSTDGGTTWTNSSFEGAIWGGYGASSVQIELLRNITLTSGSWTPTSLAYNNTVTIDGKGFTISRGIDYTAGLLFVVQYSGSTLTLKNITIDGGAVWNSTDPAARENTGVSCKGKGAHLLRVEEGAKLILEEGVILQNNDMGTAVDGGAVRVIGNGSFEMHDGVIIRNNTAGSGGAVSVISGEFMMSGGEIYGNYAANGGGGGVYINPACIFKMSGGSIYNNAATNNGGGICNAGMTTVSDGRIYGNHAPNGGGATALQGNLTITGGSITGNTAVNNGGGVYVNAEFDVSGNLVIKDNAAGSGVGNIYLPAGKTISISGALTGDQDSMGVSVRTGPTAESPTAFAVGGFASSYTPSDSDLEKFFSDNTNYRKKLENSMLQLILPPQITEDMVSLSETTFVYNGSRQEPVVTVTGSGIPLVKDTDYTVTFINADKTEAEPKAAGSYLCVVTGINAYGGTVENTFEIEKADPVVTAPSNITLTYGEALEQAVIAGGSAVDPTDENISLIGRFVWDEPETIPVADGGPYRLKFLPDDAGNYNEWSGDIFAADITINKAALTVTAKHKTAKVGDTAPILTAADYEVTGFAKGEGLADIASEADITIAYAHKPDMNVEGETVITVTGNAEITNYTIRYVNGSLTVGPKEAQDVTGGGDSGGNGSGGNDSGDNSSGGNDSGGNSSDGNDSGDNSSGGNDSGGNSSGGNDSGGNSSGGNDFGGNSSGGNGSGGNVSDGKGSGSSASGGQNSENRSEQSGSVVTVPVSGEKNTVRIEVSIDGSTVTVREAKKSEIERIVNDNNAGGVVKIDLSKLDQKINQVNLPVGIIQVITNAAGQTVGRNGNLTVIFSTGVVTLDEKTMRSVLEEAEGDEIRLVLDDRGAERLNDAQRAAVKGLQVYGGVEAYLLCMRSNKRISDFKGGIATLSIPFAIPEGMKAENFSVWYVDAQGGKTQLESWYQDGFLSWKVGHFSDFIIAYEERGENHNSFAASPQTGDNASVSFWNLILFLASAGMFLLLFVHNNVTIGKKTRRF